MIVRLICSTIGLLAWWYALMIGVAFSSGRVPRFIEEHAFKRMIAIALIGVVAIGIAARSGP
jgi:tellurite resistance protein TehA-like permease